MNQDYLIPVVPNLGKETDHEITRALLAKQVDDYLSSGGEITAVPNGVSGEKEVVRRITKPKPFKRVNIETTGELTLSDFAKKIGVSESTIYHYSGLGVIETCGNLPKMVKPKAQEKFIEYLKARRG